MGSRQTTIAEKRPERQMMQAEQRPEQQKADVVYLHTFPASPHVTHQPAIPCNGVVECIGIQHLPFRDQSRKLPSAA